MTESLWLRNMVVLGQGAPNTIRRIGGQQGRCLCTWSSQTGYCRIYPVPYGYVHDWQIADFEVRLPTNDGRKNSYAVFAYEKEWKNLSRRIRVHEEKNRRGRVVKKELNREEQIALARRLAQDTVSTIRDHKESFGVITPATMVLSLEQNREKSEAQARLADFDLSELDNLVMNQQDFAWIPVLEYSCKGPCACNHPHRQKIVEWGAYQHMKKNPDHFGHCHKLSEIYHIGDPAYEHHVLIGNLRQHPNSYLVIKIIRFKKNT